MFRFVLYFYAILQVVHSRRINFKLKSILQNPQWFPSRLANGSFPNGDVDNVWITDLEVLPVAPASARAEVYYLEDDIEKGNINFGKLTNQYHSAIGVRFGKEAFVLEFYAKYGLLGALLPMADGSWKNDAVVGVRPQDDFKNPTDETHGFKNSSRLGSITGQMWNDIRPFLVDYANTHQFYNPWRVVSKTGHVYLHEVICDTFSEVVTAELVRLGMERDLTTTPHRDYHILVAGTEPIAYDPTNAAQTQRLMAYFQKVNKLVSDLKSLTTNKEFDEDDLNELIEDAKILEGSIFIGSPGTGILEITDLVDVELGYRDFELVNDD